MGVEWSWNDLSSGSGIKTALGRVFGRVQEFMREEVGGQRHSCATCQHGHLGAPHTGNPNLSPFFHALVREWFAGQFGQALSDDFDAAEIGEKLSVTGHALILGTIFPTVKRLDREICSQDTPAGAGQSFPMPKKARNVEIGRRLQATRLALKPELSLREYIQLVENPAPEQLEPRRNLISKYESGSARVDDDWIARQRIMFGITADWILFGEMRGMPSDLHEKLHRLLQRDDLATV